MVGTQIVLYPFPSHSVAKSSVQHVLTLIRSPSPVTEHGLLVNRIARLAPTTCN